MLREFILGSNQTGQVIKTPSGVVVVGGEDPSLSGSALPGQTAIFTGSGMTEGSYTFPTATIDAWESFIATATVTGVV